VLAALVRRQAQDQPADQAVTAVRAADLAVVVDLVTTVVLAREADRAKAVGPAGVPAQQPRAARARAAGT